MRRQRVWKRFVPCAGTLGMVFVAGCGSPAKNVLSDAAALSAQGKLEEAAAKLEMGCALSPMNAPCPDSDKKASETWQKAAEKALTEGRYRDAERLFQRATLTADDAGRAGIKERLGKPDMAQGLLYERALAMPDKAAAGVVMEGISKQAAPVADKAKEWLAKERPGTLTAAVTAACGPAHEGSCSQAWEALQASGAKGPEVDKAQAQFEAEERRVYPLRVQAESFLPVFVGRYRKNEEYKKCVSAAQEGESQSPEGQCFVDTWGGDPIEKYDADKNQNILFRRTLKQIGDSAITADLERRRADAESAGNHMKHDIPKPSSRVGAPGRASAPSAPNPTAAPKKP